MWSCGNRGSRICWALLSALRLAATVSVLDYCIVQLHFCERMPDLPNRPVHEDSCILLTFCPVIAPYCSEYQESSREYLVPC